MWDLLKWAFAVGVAIEGIGVALTIAFMGVVILWTVAGMVWSALRAAAARLARSVGMFGGAR